LNKIQTLLGSSLHSIQSCLAEIKKACNTYYVVNFRINIFYDVFFERFFKFPEFFFISSLRFDVVDLGNRIKTQKNLYSAHAKATWARVARFFLAKIYQTGDIGIKYA
jgi:hypothetical protein